MSELPPKSPRKVKNKIPQRKIIQMAVPDASRFSGGVPDNIKIAMASAIMAFSQMEMSAEHFIWDVLGLSIDDGKLLTQIDAKEKFELAKKLSERYAIPIHGNPTTTSEAWATVRLIIEARNKMAHGVWQMIDKTTPVVVSYRIPIELGSVNSEHFPLDRIENVAMLSQRLSRFFDAMCARIAASPTKPTAQPPSPKPNLPEHPLPTAQSPPPPPESSDP